MDGIFGGASQTTGVFLRLLGQRLVIMATPPQEQQICRKTLQHDFLIKRCAGSKAQRTPICFAATC